MRLQVRKMEDRSEEYEGQLLRWKGEVVRLLMQAREQTLSSPLSSRARETIVDREDEMEKRALEVCCPSLSIREWHWQPRVVRMIRQ